MNRQGQTGLNLDFKAKEPNPVSSTQKVSGELGISQSSVVHHLHDLEKVSGAAEIVLHINKILQNFRFTLLLKKNKKNQSKT